MQKVNKCWPNRKSPEYAVLGIDQINDKILCTQVTKKSTLKCCTIKRTAKGMEYFITHGTRIYLKELINL